MLLSYGTLLVYNLTIYLFNDLWNVIEFFSELTNLLAKQTGISSIVIQCNLIYVQFTYYWMIWRYTLKNILQEFAISTGLISRKVDIANSFTLFYLFSSTAHA